MLEIDTPFDSPKTISAISCWALKSKGTLMLRSLRFKDIINPYKCLLKNDNFSIKTAND